MGQEKAFLESIQEADSLIERMERQRRKTILAMRNSGMTFTEIGKRMGYTRQRIQQLCKQAMRE